MSDKLNEYRRGEIAEIDKATSAPNTSQQQPAKKIVSDLEMFKMMGIKAQGRA